MPLWITEDPSTVYLLLGVAALVLAVMLWIRQERKWLYGIGVVAGLAILVAVLDFLIVTDFERIQLDVKDMADGVAAKNSERIFSHISDQFQITGMTKSAFRGWADSRIKAGDVTELRVWDFERSDATDARTRKVFFLVKGRGPEGEKLLRCLATFTLEADGKWRMTTFELRDPIKDPTKAEKFDIPSLR